MTQLSRRALLRRAAGLALLASRRFGVATARAGGPPVDHSKMVMPRAPIPRPLHADALAKFVDPLPIPPVLRATETIADPARPGHAVALYRVHMRAIEAKVHRDLPATRWWSYGTGVPGPTFEVRSGAAFAVAWHNDLPATHFLPIDHTICGAGAQTPAVRTVVHVHGAVVPPESDGYPDRWFTPGSARTLHYPNQQDAATLWYHDHAMGIERLNQYAGLFGGYFVRDHAEDALGLPGGAYEIPLFVFDRILDADGQLQYPTSGVAATPWVSEVYGDTILVNGVLTPELAVEPRAYRFRVINACNARFLYLALSNGAPVVQIGSDQGLLPAPVRLATLSLAPAERADVIVDFTALAGQSVLLMSQAFQLMRIRVAPRAVTAGHAPAPLGPAPVGPAPVGPAPVGPARLPAVPVAPSPVAPAWQPPAVLRSVPRLARASAVVTRRLGIDEYADPAHGMLMLLDGKRWRDPVSERPVLDTVEIWELVNYTGDTHPIHLHLVRFQILDRQRFDIDAYRYQHQMALLGAPIAPAAGELGWKDTVQAHPESITRIIIKFAGYAGRYVWHCHVLEHAANEMMRPFEVVAPPGRARRAP